VQEILILGRGGQGAQTAGNQLARAFFAEQQYVQTFATYGGARRGTPVTSTLRVDSRPIRSRSNISHANAMLCFDASLLDQNFLRFANNETLVVVNSSRGAGAFSGLGDYRIIPVDGREVARRADMGKVVNSALLGALVALLDRPDIATLEKVIRDTAPAKKAQNVAACRAAFDMFNGVAEGAVL